MKGTPKNCANCGALMVREKRLSYAQWSRRRFCSFTCRGRGVGEGLRTDISDSYAVTEAGCWEWKRALNWTGYGRVREPLTRRRIAAHRWVWEQKHGPVPEGLELDHLCRNRRCVNPDHLEPVTRVENARRRDVFWREEKRRVQSA